VRQARPCFSGADFTLAAALAWRKPAKPTSAHPEADVSSRVGTGSGNSSTPFGSVRGGTAGLVTCAKVARAQGCGRWLLRSAGPSDWKYCFRSRRGRVWRSGSCAKHGAEMARNSCIQWQRFRNDDRPVGMLVVESGSRLASTSPCSLKSYVNRWFERFCPSGQGVANFQGPRYPAQTGQNWRAGQTSALNTAPLPSSVSFSRTKPSIPLGWQAADRLATGSATGEPLPSQSMADEHKAHRSSLSSRARVAQARWPSLVNRRGRAKR